MKRLCLLFLILILAISVLAQSPPTYLVGDFSADELEQMLDLCGKSVIRALMQNAPFSSYGHYLWNPDFAKEGDRSVARMVERAASRGVQLGIYAQTDAISLNDSYFSPRYFSRLKRSGKVELFDWIAADQREFAMLPDEVFDQPSSLNLMLVDGELLSYGTMEPAQEVVLLYRCNRGLYGTVAAEHRASAEAYKLWDAPGRFVAPDGSLRDSVQWHLTQRIETSGLRFVRYPDEPGMHKIDGSIRVRQLEAWMQEKDSLNAVGKPLELGWFTLRAADGRQASTTLEELEWMLSKAAALDAGYGLVIDRSAIKRHGQLDKMMTMVKAWNQVRDAHVLTKEQREDLLDPYADWHLEPCGEGGYLLYPVQLSRRYRCPVTSTVRPIHEVWTWKASSQRPVSVSIEVKGQGEIRQPSLVVGGDTLLFPCTVKTGQMLRCGFNGKAFVMDADHQVLKTLAMEKQLSLPEGESEVTFSCEVKGAPKMPEVSVRYLIREQPIPIQIEEKSHSEPDFPVD